MEWWPFVLQQSRSNPPIIGYIWVNQGDRKDGFSACSNDLGRLS